MFIYDQHLNPLDEAQAQLFLISGFVRVQLNVWKCPSWRSFSLRFLAELRLIVFDFLHDEQKTCLGDEPNHYPFACCHSASSSAAPQVHSQQWFLRSTLAGGQVNVWTLSDTSVNLLWTALELPR